MTDRDLQKILCDGPQGAQLLDLKLPAFHQQLSRKRVPNAAIVRIGSAMLYRRSELLKYRDQLRALATVTAAAKAKAKVAAKKAPTAKKTTARKVSR